MLVKIVSRLFFPLPVICELMIVGLVLLWFTRRQKAGRILVTTTRRLLGYHLALRRIGVESASDEKGLCIRLGTTGTDILSEADTDGLTLYTPGLDATRVTIDSREIESFHCNSPDHTGSPSISRTWSRLEFPQL